MCYMLWCRVGKSWSLIGPLNILLLSAQPCQSLFVAACAHVWHYKCIRPMLEGKSSTYPHFQCPNCRAWTDLSAEVDVAEEDLGEWMETAGDSEDPGRTSDKAATAAAAAGGAPLVNEN